MFVTIVMLLSLYLVSINSVAQNSSNNGLLYKAEYTICLSRSQDLNSGNYVGSNMADETEIIDIYEHKVYINGAYCEYVSTNNNGERIYKGSVLNGYVTIYVNTNYNIRYINEFSYGGMYMKINVPIIKGRAMLQNNTGVSQQNHQHPSPNNNTNKTHESKHGTYTKDVTCHLCHGDGKCSTCNGKHWYYGIGGTKITCPNCKPDGRCWKCNGSGKITKTVQY